VHRTVKCDHVQVHQRHDKIDVHTTRHHLPCFETNFDPQTQGKLAGRPARQTNTIVNGHCTRHTNEKNKKTSRTNPCMALHAPRSWPYMRTLCKHSSSLRCSQPFRQGVLREAHRGRNTNPASQGQSARQRPGPLRHHMHSGFTTTAPTLSTVNRVTSLTSRSASASCTRGNRTHEGW
jgi:hypothetical protein